MRFLTLTLVLGMILGARVAFPGGSRVGTGAGGGENKPSIEMDLIAVNLRAEVPIGYKLDSRITTEANFNGPINYSRKSLVNLASPTKISLQKLNVRYPDLQTATAEEWALWFAEKNWKSLNVEDSECPKLQFIQNSDFATVVVAWGSSDGVAITFNNIESTRKDSKQIIDSLKPLNAEKKCSWK